MANHSSGMEKQIRTLRKRSLFTLFLTWLALFFTVVGIAAGYKNFLRVHDKAKAAGLDAKVARDLLPELARKDVIQDWQEQVRQQLKVSSAQNALELAELKNVSNTSAYVADTLNEQVRQLTIQQEIVKAPQRQANQWKAEEARFLLRTALRKIQLDEDPAAAQKALLLADAVLVDLGSPAYLPVRQALATDIAILERAETPNPSELVRQIDELAANLKTSMTSAPIASDDSLEALASAGGRNSLLERVQASISEVVVIKKYDQALAKRISGDAQAVRFELLRLKLESLKLLGLQQRVDAFQLQLQQIRELIKQEQAPLLTADLEAKLDLLAGLVQSPQLPKLQSPDVLNLVLSNPQPTEVEK